MEAFGEESSISIDIKDQQKSFINDFLRSRFPDICTLEILNFQRLGDEEVTQFLTKIVPRRFKALILCCNLANKGKNLSENLKALKRVIRYNVADKLVLQGFRLTDEEFSAILDECGNLKSLCIRHCKVQSAVTNTETVNINTKGIQNSETLRYLNFSMNGLPKDCVKDIFKSLEGERGLNDGLLKKLKGLDLFGNPKVTFKKPSYRNTIREKYSNIERVDKTPAVQTGDGKDNPCKIL